MIGYRSEQGRVAAYDGERRVGVCSYREEGGLWIADHTEVDPAYGGQGIAGKLVSLLAEEARKKGIRIIPECSYVRRAFSKDPEAFRDVMGE